MHKARNFAASTMLAAGLMVGGNAHADVTATAQTDIVVNFPEILVMYTFSDVTLAPDATFLTTALGLGTGGSCGAGHDCVDDFGHEKERWRPRRWDNSASHANFVVVRIRICIRRHRDGVCTAAIRCF